MSLTNSPIELLIALGVNDKTSKDNIKKYIKDLQNELPELDAMTLKIQGDSGNNKVFSDMEKQIKSLQDEIKSLNSQLNSVGKSGQGSSSFFLSDGIKKESKEVKKEIKEIGLTYQQLIDKLKSNGYEYQVKFSPDKNSIENVNKVIASVKNKFGELEKITFKPNLEGNFRQVDEVLKVDENALKKQYDVAYSKLEETISKIGRTGKMSASDLDVFKNKLEVLSISTEPLSEKVKKLDFTISDLNKKFDKASYAYKMAEATEEAGRSVENLKSKLEKLENAYKRTINTTEANKIRSQIESLPKASFGIDSNDDDVKKFKNNVKNIETQITSLHASTTMSARSSMGAVEMFRTAFEKFGIWMGASTVFFGVARSAKEFVSIIIDIDTKMTELKKVMSEGTDFESVFDRATASAEKFGQSISEAMNSYIEFARQGYQEDELGYLSDSALIASNIGDLDAQKSAEYMTASLIQWNMEAKESMSIIDSWNEISNNYATTVEKLAAGQAKAGATARAMGLDFDQLNAIIGTVTAATKQSGDEVGKYIAPLYSDVY